MPDLNTISTWSSADYSALNADFIRKMTPDQIHAIKNPELIPVAAVAGLQADQMPKLTTLQACSADWVNHLDTLALRAMTSEQLNQISPTNLAALDKTFLSALTATQVADMTHLSALSSTQFGWLNISVLSLDALKALTRTTYEGLTAAQITSLSPAQVHAMQHPDWIPETSAAGFTPDQVANISMDFKWFTGEWLNHLRMPAFQAMTPTQVSQITGNTLKTLDQNHLSALTDAQVAALTHLDVFSSDQFGWLNISRLSPDALKALTRTAYEGLTAAQITSLSPAQVHAMEHIPWIREVSAAGFTHDQVANISVDFKWFTGEWLNHLTPLAFSGITAAQLNQMTTTEFAILDSTHIAQLTNTAIHHLHKTHQLALTPKQAAALTPKQVTAIPYLSVLDGTCFSQLDLSELSPEALKTLTKTEYEGLTAKQIVSFSPDQIQAIKLGANPFGLQEITGLSPADIAAIKHITESDPAGLTEAQLKANTVSFYWLTAEWLNRLSTSVFKTMTVTQAGQLSKATLKQLNKKHLSVLTAGQVAALSHLDVLSSAQFARLNISGLLPDTLKALTKTAYEGITAAQITSLSPAQIQAMQHPDWIPASAATAFTPEQVKHISMSFYWFTGECLNHLSAAAFQAMTPTQAGQITVDTMKGLDNDHLSALTAGQVAVMTHLDVLSSARFGLLDISGLLPEAITVLTQTRSAGLTAGQIAALSPLQAQAIAHPDQLSLSAVSALTDKQVPGLLLNFSQFPAAWLNSLSLPAFKAMTATQVSQISAITVGGLNPEHLTALNALKASATVNLPPTPGLTDLSGVSRTVIANWSQADYAGLTESQMQSLSPDQIQAMQHIGWIPAAAAAGISEIQIGEFTQDFADFPAACLKNLRPLTLRALSLPQMMTISSEVLPALDNSQLALLLPVQVAAIPDLSRLSSSQFGSLDIRSLPVQTIGAWSPTEYAGLTAQQLSTLGPDQVKAMKHPEWLPVPAASGLGEAQAAALADRMYLFNADFLNNMTLPAFRALTQSRFTGLTVPSIDGLDKNHLSVFSDSLQSLDDDEILTVSSRLSAQQINSLSQSQQQLLKIAATSENALINTVSDKRLKAIMQDVIAGQTPLFSFTGIETVLSRFADTLIRPLTAGQYADLTRYLQDTGVVRGVNSSIYSLLNAMLMGANGASPDWIRGGHEEHIGHLAAGSSGLLFKELIVNWLEGGNAPKNSSPDNVERRPLFAGNTPSLKDIQQGGGENDCALLAAFQSVVNTSPDFIKSMVVENPNGTYSVRYFNNGVPGWVTVNGNSYGPGAHSDTSMWTAIFERANVEFEASYWNEQNDYKSLPGNYEKLGEITGDPLTMFRALTTTENDWITKDFEELKTAVLKGEPAQFSSWESSKDAAGKTNFHEAHAFSIISFDPVNNNFTLANPWGATGNENYNGMFEASMDQMWQHKNGSTLIAYAHSAGAAGAVGQLVTAMAAINPQVAAPLAPGGSSPEKMNTGTLAVSHT